MQKYPGDPAAAFSRFVSVSLLSVFTCLLTACSPPADEFTVMTTDKQLIQILDDAEFAVTERNFRINNRLHIGKAIRERGSAGFPDYEVILFCNLEYAKQMLELDPDLIRHCPQRLAVRDTGHERIITASLLPQNTDSRALNDVTGEVNSLVREIVEFAAMKWPLLHDSMAPDQGITAPVD